MAGFSQFPILIIMKQVYPSGQNNSEIIRQNIYLIIFTSYKKDLYFLIEQRYQMSQPIIQAIHNQNQLTNCSLQCILMYAVPIVIVLVFLKKYFSGGVFKIPNVDLSDKYAVVTGGNSGIGAETVKELSKLGCNIIIGARSKQTAEEVIKSIRSQNSKAKVQFIPLDLSSKASIQQFAKSVQFPKIDYLVNNAGIMSIPKRKLTKDGFQMQWGTNHLGHFYLTFLLWSKITASAFFRVINVSSLAHKRLLGFGGEPKPDWENIDYIKNYDPNFAYSSSKLYNVLFTKSLAQKVGKKGIIASLHPGVVRTELMRQIKSDGIKGKIASLFLISIFPVWWFVSKSALQGSQTTLFTLLSDKVESGEYYADCQKSGINSHVTKENWDRLWEISEEKLGVKFNV